MFSWACSETLACCTGIALSQAQHTLWGNISSFIIRRLKPEMELRWIVFLTSSCFIKFCVPPDVELFFVFVFTLDCNNGIYCYDTEDGIVKQPPGWQFQVTEVSQQSSNSIIKNSQSDSLFFWLWRHAALSLIVDCTCTGSLIEWFPELALDNQGLQRNHDDGLGWWFPDFFLGLAADLMNCWGSPLTEWFAATICTHITCFLLCLYSFSCQWLCKLTWLVLGEDPAARSHRVEQFTALWGL